MSISKYVLLVWFLASSLKVTGQNLIFIEENNLKIPITNDGNIGDPKGEATPRYGGIHFNDEVVLYSGGFFLSGLTNNGIWANGVFESERISDYQPGKCGTSPEEPQNTFYVLKADDEPFGESWQRWTSAVEQGAKFYDGDDDGIFNPVDKNGNGLWDEDEDRPDIIGDFTAWCVYNDGVLGDERIFTNVSPLGIEIKQTIFLFKDELPNSLGNVLFVRYEIENTGLLSAKLDSVYFSIITDPDLYDQYNRDLVGYDTTLNGGYTYNILNHSNGTPLPSILFSLLQGPHNFIPGVSYIDNNSNQLFDDGIDTPLTDAFYNHGEVLGVEIISGAVNLEVKSSTPYLRGNLSALPTPEDIIQLRNYMIGGRYPSGDPIFVSELELGNGGDLGADASNINPKYLFSGDPVNGEGWICTKPYDWRMMLSTGPFDLKENKPVVIIGAYIVGQADSSLLSVNEVKILAGKVKDFYDENFQNFIVGVEQLHNEYLTEFSLSQNYPNPFNPTTTIKYTVAIGEALNVSPTPVSFKVFDTLGRQVATLVNKIMSPGTYEVQFNGSNLSSGIYFYRLIAGSYSQTKKMILLR